MTIIFAETPVPDVPGRRRRCYAALSPAGLDAATAASIDLLCALTVTPRQPTIGLHFRHPRDFGKRAVAAPSGVRLNSSLIVAAANGVAHPIWTDSRRLGALGEEIYTTRLRESDVFKR